MEIQRFRFATFVPVEQLMEPFREFGNGIHRREAHCHPDALGKLRLTASVVVEAPSGTVVVVTGATVGSLFSSSTNDCAWTRL